MKSTFTPVREFFHLGRVLKSHGTSGQMRLMLEDRFKSYVKPPQYLFIDLDGSRVPYRITEAEDGQHFIISLDTITRKEQSDAFAGKEIFIPIEDVKPRHLKSPKNLGDKWEEYRLLNVADDSVYQILRTEEYPQQLMAVILVDSREVLVPLNDQLITEIDHEQKVIRMEIPDGLFEL